MEEFVRYRDFVFETVQEMNGVLQQPDEDMPPVLMLLGPDWADAISLQAYADAEGGFGYLAEVGLRSIIERTAPVRAALIFAAFGRWVEPDPSGGVREVDDREELVVVQVADQSGNYEEWQCPVDRHQDKPQTLQAFEQQPETEGVFKEALKKAFLKEVA